jgi:predicted  nucleic acid-binding Zn-ribbon protein
MTIRVWDGTTPARPNLTDIKNPDHMDYIFLVVELQKLQEAFLYLVQNISLMPNLQGELDKALATIAALQETIATLTPPQDLKDKIAGFEQALSEQDTRKKLANLHGTSEGLRTQVDKYQMQVLELQKVFANQVIAFQNKIWNALQKLKKDTQSRLEATEEQLKDVSVKLSILNLQQELKK